MLVLGIVVVSWLALGMATIAALNLLKWFVSSAAGKSTSRRPPPRPVGSRRAYTAEWTSEADHGHCVLGAAAPPRLLTSPGDSRLRGLLPANG